MRFRVSKNTNKMVMDKLINWDFSDEAEKQIASADKTHKELYANFKNFINYDSDRQAETSCRQDQ